MTDDVWQRDEIESPCVKICMIHPDAKLCIGCYRTSDEIAGWSGMTPEDRQALIEELSSRRNLLPRRRGGRAARSLNRAS
jgi:predicted Fe-S protein YdhL (DUF1289 family)